MKAAVLHTIGKAPRFEEFPEPTPGSDEVLVHVHAAALKPVEIGMANGTHYAAPRELPVVCGLDGVGRLEDGSRVFFAGPRSPYGAMAERTMAPRAWCWPIPGGIDDVTAAALANPGLSSWLPLTWRAQLALGETVLILGATGVAGKLAVQIAKLLGAARVVAAGRNQQILNSLQELGADATIRVDQPAAALAEAFAREAGDSGYDVIIDYLWGAPTEALLAALARKRFFLGKAGARLVQVGDTAGPAITLPAAVLRSSGLSILGSSLPPKEFLSNAFHQLMARAAAGEIRIATEVVPLEEIESAWSRRAHPGVRRVVIP